MGRSSALLVGGLVFAMAACGSVVGGGSEGPRSTGSELIGGEAGVPFNSGTVLIAGSCTAVMIGSNQILTAAHCVARDLDPDASAGNVLDSTIDPHFARGTAIAMTNSGLVALGGNWFKTTILGIDIDPDFEKTCASGCPSDFSLHPPYPPDLAIITIADVFPQSMGMSAMVMSAGYGDTVTETGYGCTIAVDTPDPSQRMFKHAEATILDPAGTGVPSSFKVPNVTDFTQNYYITLGKSAGGQASLCPGDSGGPLFKGPWSPYVADEVVGVNAYYTFTGASGVSDVNVFARLDSGPVMSWMASTVNKYAMPNPANDRGHPINDGYDPVSSLFPISTVALETPGTPGCTGVILTQNKILTAAHCGVGPTTVARFFALDTSGGNLPILSINASNDPVATQGNLTCARTDANFPFSCFTSVGATGTYHNADLAVLTLSNPVPIGFSPVAIGKKGYSAQGQTDLPVWWEIAAGGPTPIDAKARMMWGPGRYEPDSAAAQAQGYYYFHSVFGLLNDVGGPVFRGPSYDDDGGTDGGADGGFYLEMALLGIVSDVGDCPGTVCVHQNSVVSVTFPDNYDWLVGLGASPVSAFASFGASN